MATLRLGIPSELQTRPSDPKAVQAGTVKAPCMRARAAHACAHYDTYIHTHMHTYMHAYIHILKHLRGWWLFPKGVAAGRRLGARPWRLALEPPARATVITLCVCVCVCVGIRRQGSQDGPKMMKMIKYVAERAWYSNMTCMHAYKEQLPSRTLTLHEFTHVGPGGVRARVCETRHLGGSTRRGPPTAPFPHL